MESGKAYILLRKLMTLRSFGEYLNYIDHLLYEQAGINLLAVFDTILLEENVKNNHICEGGVLYYCDRPVRFITESAYNRGLISAAVGKLYTWVVIPDFTFKNLYFYEKVARGFSFVGVKFGIHEFLNSLYHDYYSTKLIIQVSLKSFDV